MSSVSDFLSTFSFGPSLWLFCSSWSTCILFFTKQRKRTVCYMNNEVMQLLQKWSTIINQIKPHTGAAADRPFSHALFAQRCLDMPQFFFLFNRAHISVVSRPGFKNVYYKSSANGRTLPLPLWEWCPSPWALLPLRSSALPPGRHWTRWTRHARSHAPSPSPWNTRLMPEAPLSG